MNNSKRFYTKAYRKTLFVHTGLGLQLLFFPEEIVHMLVFSGERRLTDAGLLLALWGWAE